jgi:hypothetical protein
MVAPTAAAPSARVCVTPGRQQHDLDLARALATVTSDTTVELRIDVSGDANATIASDTNTLVLFRNGFQMLSDTQ